MSGSSFAIDVDISSSAEGELIDNVSAHLSSVAPPFNCELSEQYLELIEQTVKKAAEALGYYHPVVTQVVLAGDKCEVAEFHLDSGPLTKVASIDLQLVGEGATDKTFSDIYKVFPLSVDGPLLHAKYSSYKNKILNQALLRGYFDSQFAKQQILVDVEANKANITLIFDTQKRYQFGEVSLPDSEQAQTIVKQIIPFKVGDDYHAHKLGELNQKLKLTEYFQQVVARPVLNEAVNHAVPIEIIATNKARDIFNVGGGFSTDIGPRFSAKWQRPWVNSKGHSLGAQLFISQPLQKASLKYKIPLQDPLNNYYTLQGGFKYEDDNDTNSENYTLAVQRHWGSDDSEWQKIAFVRYEQERFRQGVEPYVTTNLLMPGATLSRHRTQGGLDVNWGDKQQLTVEVASKSFVSDIDLTRITFKTKWLRSFGVHRVLLRGAVGAINTDDFSRVPSSLRYFAGGDQSVRGFGFQTLSPIEQEELTGGKYLNVASVEYTYPVAENWRMAAFYDTGNASNEPFKNLAKGYGIGASWQSPVGPIRFYLARGQSEFENTIRIHLSMGPSI